MTELDALAARIDGLETRIAYQDQTIEDLNKALLDQWRHVEGLTRQLARLGDRVAEAEATARTPTQPEPPPPHY